MNQNNNSSFHLSWLNTYQVSWDALSRLLTSIYFLHHVAQYLQGILGCCAKVADKYIFSAS